jgi:hypothetical protein
VVVAPASAGKSFFCKLLMLRQLCRGTDCIVVDPENEYSRVAEAADGQVVRLAASSAHRINPFRCHPQQRLPARGRIRLRLMKVPPAKRVTALFGLLRARLFAGPTNVELDRRVVVFNIQQLEDELRPLAIHLIAGWVWTRVRRDPRPRNHHPAGSRSGGRRAR